MRNLALKFKLPSSIWARPTSHRTHTYYVYSGDISGKEQACQSKQQGFNPWVGEEPLEKEMVTHSSILATNSTEEPDGLQFMESPRHS